MKKTDEMTPQWPLSLVPCARNRWRPLEREVVLEDDGHIGCWAAKVAG